VARFHSTNTEIPALRNPTRAAAVPSRFTDIAVDSSITRCAAATRRQPVQASSGASRSPYNPLRIPSSSAVAPPATGAPPEATTPTSAN
jgi:hypothetical protein